MDAIAELSKQFDGYHRETVEGRKALDEKLDQMQARADQIERKANRSMLLGGSPHEPESWGASLTRSDALRDFKSAGYRGTSRLEVKAVTSGAASAGALIAPDRQSEVITLPKRRLTIRQLLGAGQTTSNVVYFTKQTGFNNAAAPVAELALKGESSIAFTPTETPVRTLAHWLAVSRQAFDDIAALSSLVDTELRYGLEFVEEQQLLLGDGTGENLFGMIPQATAYETSRNAAGDNEADTVAHAIAQAEIAQLPATGVIMNTDDWNRLILLKSTTGEYLGGGPFANQARNLWTLPVSVSASMPARKFLVGAFGTAVQVFDRMTAEVLISDQDRDNFVKNALTIRAEQRLALAVKRPEALIFGTFPQT